MQTTRSAAAVEFGRRVLKLRKDSKMSRRELAGLADMDDSHLARVERGFVNPSLHMIIQLAVALKTTPEKLVSGLGEKHLPANRRPYSVEDFRREQDKRDPA